MTCLNEARTVSCSNCGKKIGTQDRFCSACGKALIVEQEQEMELLSFGPWGVSVCFGHPGFFVWTQQNNTKIVLTNRRIYGLALFSGKLRFQAFYNAITSKENISFALFKVLYLQYRDAERIKEVSIMGNPANYANIARAYELVPRK
jgi:hypothetical protein